jgi:sortase A
MTSQSKTKRYLSNILMVALLAIGLILIFQTPIRNMIVAWQSNRYAIENVSADDLRANNQDGNGSFNFDAVEAVSFDKILLKMGNPSNLPVIGGIAIPELGMNLPIFRGVGNTELSYGAGTMKPDQEMGRGNYALASHHVQAMHLLKYGLRDSEEVASEILFSPLVHAEASMTVYITDKETVYEYVINDVSVVTPNHVEVIDDVSGKNLLTLVTCEDNGEKRAIVHAELITQYDYDSAPSKTNKAFQAKYNTWQW